MSASQSDAGQPGVITGRCLCGAVRYRSSAPPIASRVCWCRLCQFLGSGSGTVNVCFRSATFSVEGELKDYPSVADSGTRMHRRFCGTCGTPLFSEAESRPHLIFVRAGSLDDPELGRPSATIWTDAAPTWACMDSGLARFPRQPPPSG